MLKRISAVLLTVIMMLLVTNTAEAQKKKAGILLQEFTTTNYYLYIYTASGNMLQAELNDLNGIVSIPVTPTKEQFKDYLEDSLKIFSQFVYVDPRISPGEKYHKLITYIKARGKSLYQKSNVVFYYTKQSLAFELLKIMVDDTKDLATVDETEAPDTALTDGSQETADTGDGFFSNLFGSPLFLILLILVVAAVIYLIVMYLQKKRKESEYSYEDDMPARTSKRSFSGEDIDNDSDFEVVRREKKPSTLPGLDDDAPAAEEESGQMEEINNTIKANLEKIISLLQQMNDGSKNFREKLTPASISLKHTIEILTYRNKSDRGQLSLAHLLERANEAKDMINKLKQSIEEIVVDNPESFNVTEVTKAVNWVDKFMKDLMEKPEKTV